MNNNEVDALRLLDSFMGAWNARDVQAFRATFNYPSVRIASGKIRILEGPEAHPDDLFERMAATGWHHSQWLRRNILHSSGDGEEPKVHFDTRFGRYREDGTTIGEYDSIYIVNKQDGHWGVQGRSSFAP